MTIPEAKNILDHFYSLQNPAEEERFLFVEALNYLIEQTKSDKYMAWLASYYYDEHEFDLALKYYELAAEKNNRGAICALGYIWYYGRTGKIDYEKAFSYFDRARKMGDRIAAYKVADMYKNGFHVEKDEGKYREIIEDLYGQLQKTSTLNAPVPEVYTRLARIRVEEGRSREALVLYNIARDFLSQRIYYDPFFGNLSIMKCLIEDQCRLRPLRPGSILFYDLFEVLRRPCRVRFSLDNTVHETEAAEEADGTISVRFDDRWFRSVYDFFQKACIDGEPLTHLYDRFYDFEVIS